VIVAAAVVRDGAVLAQQRAYPVEAAGRWELPGGRVEDGETEVAALRRECAEELGVRILVGERVGADVELVGGAMLRVFAARLGGAQPEPRALEHRALRWVAAAELTGVDWLPADRVLLPSLAQLLGPAAPDPAPSGNADAADDAALPGRGGDMPGRPGLRGG
jgi:8-oxo-dGTP diphosphatase